MYNPLLFGDSGNPAHGCTRRLIRTAALVFFSLVLFTTACLYTKVVIALRRGIGNASRKKTLTVAFACLWVFWFIQSAPFVLYDFYDVWATNKFSDVTLGLGQLMGYDFRLLYVSFDFLAITIFLLKPIKAKGGQRNS